MFDEIFLSCCISFNPNKDFVEGFVDFGANDRRANFADNALVFILKGVHKSWKQPICFYFCERTTSTVYLVRVLKEAIRHVRLSSLKIVATVCDRGATYNAAINVLLNETNTYCIEENIENKFQGYLINGKEIVHLFDPPYLLKGIRNSLLNKLLYFKQDGFVRPRSFNQDPLENFFGQIRSHGVRNVNPMCISFISSTKALTVNFMSSHFPSFNCGEDLSTGALDSLKDLIAQEDTSDSNSEIDLVSEYTLFTSSINEIEKFYKSILEQVSTEDNELFIPIQSDKTFTPISTDEIDEAKKNWPHNKQIAYSRMRHLASAVIDANVSSVPGPSPPMFKRDSMNTGLTRSLQPKA
ncbi:uncharacterized protein LOC126265983 [Aethina tumida]|uniref:uncharacterized protein LOC126265983 n=1 Tax=Aethina tumida TaxID=116153 RepID=UPI0021483FA3|nr:uncharacterized protein LOC126265983 [Aethina tumida]